MMNRPELLVIIRHAQSARNLAKKGTVYFADEEARKTLKSIPDHIIPLTDLGMIQAEKTGIALRERFGTPDYVYHSGYKRTIQTAEGILKAYLSKEQNKIKIRQNLFIRERDPGYTYEMTQPEAETAFPWLREYWDTFGGFFSRPVGGESLADVVNRVYAFINMLFRDRQDQKVFIITHGGTLRCFRYILERWDYEQALKWPPGQSPKNCGLTVYKYDRDIDRLVLSEYNTVYYDNPTSD